jgi:hypothetical protein
MKWAYSNDPAYAREIQGPAIEHLQPQSPLAPKLLTVFKEVVLKNPDFVNTLKRHYQQFRSAIKNKHNN